MQLDQKVPSHTIIQKGGKNILARWPKVLPCMEHSMRWCQRFTSASCSVVQLQARTTRPSSDHSNKDIDLSGAATSLSYLKRSLHLNQHDNFFNYTGNVSFHWGQNHRSISLATNRLGTQPLGSKGNKRKLTLLNCLLGRGSWEGIPSSEPKTFW